MTVGIATGCYVIADVCVCHVTEVWRRRLTATPHTSFVMSQCPLMLLSTRARDVNTDTDTLS